MKSLLFLAVCSSFAACSQNKPHLTDPETGKKEIYLFHDNGKVKTIFNYKDGNVPIPYDGFYFSGTVPEEEIPGFLTDIGYHDPEFLRRRGANSSLLMYFPASDLETVRKFIEMHKNDPELSRFKLCYSNLPEKISGDSLYSLYVAYKVENSQKTVPGWSVSSAEVSNRPDFKTPIVNISFTEPGSREFGEFTANNTGTTILMIFGDKVIAAPRVMHAIRAGNVEVAGFLDENTADEIVKSISSNHVSGEAREYSEEGKLTEIKTYKNGELTATQKILQR